MRTVNDVYNYPFARSLALALIFGFCSARLYGQLQNQNEVAITTKQESDRPQEINAPPFGTIPSEVEVDLGDVIAGRDSYHRIFIKNNSSNVFRVTDSKSDCGCLVGIIPNQSVSPGDRVDLGVKLRPSYNADQVRRVLTVYGDSKNAGDVLVVKIRANCKQAVSLNPKIIDLGDVAPESFSFDVSAADGIVFDDGLSLVASEGAVMNWSFRMVSTTKGVLTATWKDPSVRSVRFAESIEHLSIRSGEKHFVDISVPIRNKLRPEIRPKKVVASLSEGGWKASFFVIGDWDATAGELDKGRFLLKFAGKSSSLNVSTEWRSSRIGVCEVQVPKDLEAIDGLRAELVFEPKDGESLRVDDVFLDFEKVR